MDRIPIALPPLAEQQRVVAKVDELMALCNQLEEAHVVRKEARAQLTRASFARLVASEVDAATFHSNARFAINTLPALTTRADQVENLRQAILNLAVSGKLVEQNPEDEPTVDLMKRIETARFRNVQARRVTHTSDLRNIAPSDMPYDLPKTWRWTNFGSIAEFSAGRTPPRKNTSYWNTGEFSWISIADIVDGATVQRTKETVSDKARTDIFKCQPVAPGTMIMSFKLTIGKIARLGIPAFHNEAIIAIRPYLDEIDPYLFKVLPDFARRGNTKGAIKGATLNRRSISDILIPLPPVAEQRRIVAKVNELLALSDRLEANLIMANATRSRLLESALHKALGEVHLNQ